MKITFWMSRHPEQGFQVDAHSVTGAPFIGDPLGNGWEQYGPFTFEPSWQLSTKIMSLTHLAQDDKLIDMSKFDANWQAMVIGVCLDAYVLGMASSPKAKFSLPEELHRQMVAIWMRAGEDALLFGGVDSRWQQLVEGMCEDAFKAGQASEIRLMLPREA